MAGQRSVPDPSRRRFLAGAAAAAVGVATGCSDDGGSSGSAGSTAPPTTARPASSTTLHTARLPADPFAMGVASGDPLPDSVILWTRLAPDPLALDGLGAMPPDQVDVVWEVGTDDRFSRSSRAGSSPPSRGTPMRCRPTPVAAGSPEAQEV